MCLHVLHKLGHPVVVFRRRRVVIEMAILILVNNGNQIAMLMAIHLVVSYT